MKKYHINMILGSGESISFKFISRGSLKEMTAYLDNLWPNTKYVEIMEILGTEVIHYEEV